MKYYYNTTLEDRATQILFTHQIRNKVEGTSALQGQAAWTEILTLLLATCCSLGNSLYFPETQFSPFYKMNMTALSTSSEDNTQQTAQPI